MRQPPFTMKIPITWSEKESDKWHLKITCLKQKIQRLPQQPMVDLTPLLAAMPRRVIRFLSPKVLFRAKS